MSETGKDGLLINKIMGAFLTAGLVFWAANRIAGIVVPDDAPKNPAIKIVGVQAAAAPSAAATTLASIIPLLATADVAKGQAFVQQQCSSCHTLNKGGAAGVGPNLYGIMGEPVFVLPGYGFSAAAQSKAKGNWDYDNMNTWLAAPQSYAPGTTMSYPGIKNTQSRDDAVAYLRSLAASPIPLPTPAQIKAASAAPTPPAGQAAATTASAAPAEPDMNTLLANADLTKGQAVVQQQCSACHTLNKGGAAGIGPNLYGIVGAKMFAQPGFSYSDAAKSKATGNWTVAELSDWLADPGHVAPGTEMAFAGLHNDQTRADAIAWLNHDADKPLALGGK